MTQEIPGLSQERPRLRETGLVVGFLPNGPGNAITDVSGVAVGHLTLLEPEAGMCTGVTVITPVSAGGWQRLRKRRC